MEHSKQNGFNPIISVLVVATLVALAVWFIHSLTVGNKNTETVNSGPATNAINQNTPPAKDPNEGYKVIKEWGVRFKSADGLKPVYFRAPDTPAAYDRFDFSTTDLIAIEPNCKQKGFSSLSRTATPQNEYGSLLTKIGDYYYYYWGSSAACSEKNANMAFESQQRTAVKESLNSLEAAQ